MCPTSLFPSLGGMALDGTLLMLVGLWSVSRELGEKGYSLGQGGGSGCSRKRLSDSINILVQSKAFLVPSVLTLCDNTLGVGLHR